MRLLIVDDEHLTRDGIYGSFDWEAHGIHRVMLAEDGMQGLQIARHFKPDIILSDVRMPRLDGIQMAEKIREFLPECMVIFMSGYSDKEYLKSAIRLKAVNYVEKPIDLSDLQTAFRDAARQINEQRESMQGKQLHAAMKESELALRLVQPHAAADLTEQLRLVGVELKRTATFTVVAADISAGIEWSAHDCTQRLTPVFERYCAKFGCKLLHGVKNDGMLLCHLLFPETPPYGAVQRFCSDIFEPLRELYPTFVAAGRTVSALSKITDSYNDAVSLLQSSFFLESSSVIRPQSVGGSHQVPAACYEHFRKALSQGSSAHSMSLLEDLLHNFNTHNGTLVSYVKDVYSKLLYELSDIAGEQYISLWETTENGGTITNAVGDCQNLAQLHGLLRDKTALYHQILEKKGTEDSMVRLIQGYISANIEDSALSIRTISDYTSLSTSYVCTLYKNETGETLNQFITNVRVERAKQLLRDPRLRVNDIAAAVGYVDSNYFAKLFKKKTGISPSEYRESNLK